MNSAAPKKRQKEHPGTTVTNRQSIAGPAQDSMSSSDSVSVPQPRRDLTLILLLLAIFIFNSPFTGWWSSLRLPWYAIFIFWLILIALVAFNQIKTNNSKQ